MWKSAFKVMTSKPVSNFVTDFAQDVAMNGAADAADIKTPNTKPSAGGTAGTITYKYMKAKFGGAPSLPPAPKFNPQQTKQYQQFNQSQKLEIQAHYRNIMQHHQHKTSYLYFPKKFGDDDKL